MSLRDDALATLTAWPPPSAAQDVLRTTYLGHLRAHDDALWRDGHRDHLTASGLVLSPDRAQVLLTLHRKAQRWFQFGGHLEPGDDTLAGAAAREAAEESGVDDLVLDPVPVHLDLHDVPFCGPGVRHLDVRFVLHAPAGTVPTATEESLDVRWWPVDALPGGERSLHELVQAAVGR